MSRMIIRHHKPWRGWILTALVVILSLLIGVMSYRFSQKYAQLHYEKMQFKELDVRDYRQKMEELQNENVRLKRQYSIEQQVNRELKNELVTMEQQTQELRHELAFYQGIVVHDPQQDGLSVRGVRIDEGEEGNHILRLVLTKMPNNGMSISGQLDIELLGEYSTSKKLANFSVSSQKFTFKYFENVTADFILPDDFVPNKIRVVAQPIGKGQKPMEEQFPWSLEPLTVTHGDTEIQ